MLKKKQDISPEIAPELAKRFVDFTKSIEGIDLDYSVQSLELVDGILEGMRETGLNVKEQHLTLIIAGCYIGEIIIRLHNLRWVRSEITPYSKWSGMVPIVIEYGQDKYTSPINKVIKRLENGKEDHLPFYYQALCKQIEEGPEE